ncbi:MAG: DUF937 domain-containing protein [Rhodoglobus sp.]
MSDLDGLISQIPIGDIAKKLGIDEKTAREAVAVAVPAIVGGMNANAQAGGAKSLEKALASHAGRPVNIDAIDEEDGQKIVNNVFGNKKTEVVSAVSKPGGTDLSDIVAKVLPIIAPIVLAYLAKQFLGGKKDEAAKPSAAEPTATSGGIGDLLGGLLGSQQGQDIVGGLLGGLLGGGKK